MSTPHFIVTANDLADGSVRYLAHEATGRAWPRDIRAASLTADPGLRDAWLAEAAADVAANRIIAPYAIDVIPGRDGPEHGTVRERVRAAGPSTGNSLKHHGQR